MNQAGYNGRECGSVVHQRSAVMISCAARTKPVSAAVAVVLITLQSPAACQSASMAAYSLTFHQACDWPALRALIHGIQWCCFCTGRGCATSYSKARRHTRQRRKTGVAAEPATSRYLRPAQLRPRRPCAVNGHPAYTGPVRASLSSTRNPAGAGFRRHLLAERLSQRKQLRGVEKLAVPTRVPLEGLLINLSCSGVVAQCSCSNGADSPVLGWV